MTSKDRDALQPDPPMTASTPEEQPTDTRPARSRAASIGLYLIGLAIVGAMVTYVIRQGDLLSSIRSISLGVLAVLVIANLAVVLISGAQFRRMCRVFDAPVSYLDGLALSVTGLMLNYAIPLKGGMVMRAAYMKHRYRMSYALYGALLASSQLIAVSAAAISGLAISAIAISVGHRASWVLAGAFALALAGALIAYRLVEATDFSRFRFVSVGRHLTRFSAGFSHWRSNPRSAAWYAATVGLIILIGGARLNVLFTALGVDAQILTVYLVSATVFVSNTVPVTPGNLGIREVTMVLAAGLLGIDTEVALLASLVERAIGLTVLMALGIPLSQRLVHGVARQPQTDLSGTET